MFFDSRGVEVAYQLTDAAGRTAVDLEALAVNLALTLHKEEKETTGASAACGLPDAATGIGLCEATLSSGWFSDVHSRNATLTVAVAYGGAAAAAATSAELWVT